MSNMHRILWFDEQVRYGKYPNSGHLAERFEISVRHACRDIEYMMNSLGAPLVYHAKHRGYRYEDQTFILPALMLTGSDIEIIRQLIRHFHEVEGAARDNAQDGSFSEKAVGLLKKIISHVTYEDD
ncbi:MAG: transcriptional regulator [Paenibacillaceae bacterium]|jgi:predicted DNA-binding transcriptional regulator YafY|nr:transcriptional regulator [Paenibacillaceae bacterium]